MCSRAMDCRAGITGAHTAIADGSHSGSWRCRIVCHLCGGGCKQGDAHEPGPHARVKQPSTSKPTHKELDRADTDTSNWLLYNKGYQAHRYSSLGQMNGGNASALRPLCLFQLGEVATFTTGPVVYDGILFMQLRISARTRSTRELARRSGRISTCRLGLKRTRRTKASPSPADK